MKSIIFSWQFWLAATFVTIVTHIVYVGSLVQVLPGRPFLLFLTAWLICKKQYPANLRSFTNAVVAPTLIAWASGWLPVVVASSIGLFIPPTLVAAAGVAGFGFYKGYIKLARGWVTAMALVFAISATYTFSSFSKDYVLKGIAHRMQFGESSEDITMEGKVSNAWVFIFSYFPLLAIMRNPTIDAKEQSHEAPKVA